MKQTLEEEIDEELGLVVVIVLKVYLYTLIFIFTNFSFNDYSTKDNKN